jgi:hypothetical protein
MSGAGGSRPSRRALLGGAAAGAAATWATPSILTIDVAGAGAATCSPFTVDWSAFAASVDALEATGFPVPVGGHWQLDVSYDDSGMAAGGTDEVGFALSSPLGGETTGFVELQLHPGNPPDADGAAGEFTELTLAFTDTNDSLPAPVQGLSFTLLDIDLSTGEWQDDVQLVATLGGAPVLLAPGDATIVDPGVVVAGGGPTFDSFTAVDGPVDNSTTNGNVAISYSSPLDTLVIRFTALAGIQAQQIGITGLTGCIF